MKNRRYLKTRKPTVELAVKKLTALEFRCERFRVLDRGEDGTLLCCGLLISADDGSIEFIFNHAYPPMAMAVIAKAMATFSWFKVADAHMYITPEEVLFDREALKALANQLQGCSCGPCPGGSELLH